MVLLVKEYFGNPSPRSSPAWSCPSQGCPPWSRPWSACPLHRDLLHQGSLLLFLASRPELVDNLGNTLTIILLHMIIITTLLSSQVGRRLVLREGVEVEGDVTAVRGGHHVGRH